MKNKKFDLIVFAVLIVLCTLFFGCLLWLGNNPITVILGIILVISLLFASDLYEL